MASNVREWFKVKKPHLATGSTDGSAGSAGVDLLFLRLGVGAGRAVLIGVSAAGSTAVELDAVALAGDAPAVASAGGAGGVVGEGGQAGGTAGDLGATAEGRGGADGT